MRSLCSQSRLVSDATFSILFLGTAADPTFFFLYEQAEEIHETLPGTMLYGFTKVPPLDVLTTWPEKHDVVVESGHHKVKNFCCCIC